MSRLAEANTISVHIHPGTEPELSPIGYDLVLIPLSGIRFEQTRYSHILQIVRPLTPPTTLVTGARGTEEDESGVDPKVGRSSWSLRFGLRVYTGIVSMSCR